MSRTLCVQCAVGTLTVPVILRCKMTARKNQNEEGYEMKRGYAICLSAALAAASVYTIPPDVSYAEEVTFHTTSREDDTADQTGWVKQNDQWYYYKNGSARTGWVKLNGKWYFFNESGIMQTGWFQDNGKWYYANSHGVMRTGWIKDNGHWYHTDSSGAMQTGWFQDNGKWYYANALGIMRIGWISDNGSWYYTDSQGVMQTGWQTISGDQYYFNKAGVMQTGQVKIGGKEYNFSDQGVLRTGWVEEDGKWYYFDKSGQMLTGWSFIDKNKYYFEEDGSMATGQYRVDGVLHNFGSNGAWKNEIIEHKEGDYNAAKAINFAVTHTAVDISKGLSATQCIYGWQCAEFGSNVLKAGGAINEYDDHATALHRKLANNPLIEEFVVPIEDGYIKLANVPKGHAIAPGDLMLLYCPFERDGRPFVHTLMFYGWSPDGLAKVYCHNSRTAGTVSHRIYCYACHGVMSEAHVMHIKTNTDKENNAYPANTWMNIKGKKLHINSRGIKDTGFTKVGEDWYFFDEDGVMKTGWIKCDDGSYYFGKSGKMVTGWQKLDGSWYFFNDGLMQTGWLDEDGHRYYFEENGKMVTNTKMKIDGKTYTFGKTGACQNP